MSFVFARRHCHSRILFFFTYAKIEYVSVRAYLIEYVRYTYPRALLTSSETLIEHRWCAKGFCWESLFLFVAAAAYSQLLCGLLGKYLLVSELHNAHIVRQVFFDYNFQPLNLGWQCVLRGSLFTQILSMTISWRHISQDMVATRLRCGGNFNHHFIVNVSRSLLTVKEFWKSVKIW